MAKNGKKQDQQEQQVQRQQEVVTVKYFTPQGDQQDQQVWRKAEDGNWQSDRGNTLSEKGFDDELKRLESRETIKIERDTATNDEGNPGRE